MDIPFNDKILGLNLIAVVGLVSATPLKELWLVVTMMPPREEAATILVLVTLPREIIFSCCQLFLVFMHR